jgi:hypothetical protein
MKIFEFGNPPSPDATTSPATTALGANAMRTAMHSKSSGLSVAKALSTLGQGKSLSPNLAKQIEPYADALQQILSNTQFRNKFLMLVKAVQNAENKSSESVNEDNDSVDAVASSITRRIMSQHLDVLSKYGPAKVLAAIDDVAQFAGGDGLDEIGSSDVSIWTKQVIQSLESGHFDHMEGIQEGFNSEAEHILAQCGSGDLDAYDVMNHPKTPAEQEAAKVMQSMYDDVAIDHHLHPDDDFEKILDIVCDQLEQQYGNSDADTYESVQDDNDTIDTVTLDVPLMIRMMEYAREDAKDDMDLHDVAERMISMSKNGPLSMDDYDSIVGSVESLPDQEEKPMDEGYYAPGPETMPGAVGPQENTTVSFNQSKTMGDATLNISASAKDMDELHRMLKLAGINYDDNREPSMQDVAVALAPHMPADLGNDDDESCGCDEPEEPVAAVIKKPLDLKYSTDKTALVNALRDKLGRI